MRWRSTAGARSKPRARAIAMVMDGASRTEAARAQGLELQVLRDRVLRSSTEGLVDRPRGGSEGRLTQAQVAEVGAWIEAGPDRERDGVTRRRVRDIVRKIEEAFGVVHTQKRCPHDASKGRVSLRLGAAGPPQGGCGATEGVRGGLRGTVDVDAHRRGAGGPGRDRVPGRSARRPEGDDDAGLVDWEAASATIAMAPSFCSPPPARSAASASPMWRTRRTRRR